MPPKIDKTSHLNIRKRELNILEGFEEAAEALTDETSIDLVESKLEGLEQSWINFNDADQKLCELAEDSEYSSAERPYYTAKSIFKAFLRKHSPAPTIITNQQDSSKLNETMGEFVAHQKTFLWEFSQLRQGQQEAKLPRANIPQFRGDYQEWASFKDLFTGQIHSNLRLSKATKFQYLKGCLGDRAAKTIEHIPISDVTYDQAWLKLCKRFEKRTHIANSFFQTLVDQPVVTKCSVDQLRRLCDTSDEVLRGLTALDKSTTKRDSLVIFILLQKMDPETRRMWAEHVVNKEFPTEDDFLEFLTTRCDSLEMSQTQVTSTKSEFFRNSSKVRIHTASADTDVKSTFKCIQCSGNHKLFKCPTFQAMDVHSRRGYTAEKSLCFNCLGANHSSNNCFSPQRCHKCSQKHHTLLHVNALAISQPNKNIEVTSCNASCGQPSTSFATQPLNNHQSQPKCSTANPINVPPYSPVHNAALQSISKQMLQSSNSLQENPLSSSSSVVTQQINTSTSLGSHCSSLLPTAIILVKDKLGVSQPCRALLDSGSQVTLITESLAQKLQLPRKHAKIPITGLAGAGAGYTRGSVELYIKSRYNHLKAIECQALILHSLTTHTPEYSTTKDEYKNVINLPLADPELTKSSPVDIILGAGEFFEILLPETIKRNDRVIAQNTIFGWIICGNKVKKPENQTSISNVATTDVDVLLRQFWEVEEVHSTTSVLSEEEEAIEEHFLNTTSRTKDGRFIVSLPFKPNIPNLGNSKQAAISRLMAMERKFQNNSKLQQDYFDFMDEYANLGHMKIIPDVDLAEAPVNTYYLPHHAVTKESQGKPKLRIVFDGSSKTSSGISLNQKLMVGPTVQNTLLSLVMKFRKHKIVFASDIEKMYRQILIAPDDREFQRIVWRKSTSEPIKHYRLHTVTYGLASSPFQAIRSLNQLALDHKSDFPLAAEIVLNDFYVDDVMSGANDLLTASEIRDQLIQLMNRGGFNLRKWKSNSKEFLKAIPPNDQEVSPLDFDETKSIKVLGLQWHPDGDCFSYNIDLPQTHTLTKRQLLSEASRLFDPLGLLAPSVIIIKILFQSLWVLKLSWDDLLPSDIAAKWINLRNSFHHFTAIRIPRLAIVHENEIQIHGFSDASENAYAAAVYIRSKNNKGDYISRLIAAKTKVAPIKQLSIPRLELCGACLLTRLLQAVVKSMCLPDAEMFAWTDSTTVLQWLRSPPRKWKSFIGNRTAEIHTNLPQCQWKHVSSKENPADHATRGILPDDLKDLNIWWNGPEFLKQDETVWPKQKLAYQTNQAENEEKTKKIHLFAAGIDEDYIAIISTKYSSWQKLLRIFSYIFRFITNSRLKARRNKQAKIPAITPNELKRAASELYKQVQKVVFAEELRLLKAGKDVSSKSRIASLHPFLDDKSVIRAGGRLENANISYGRKHPIILPSDHHITTLIIANVHQYTLHGGTSIMLFHLRQNYWILGCRNRVKKFIHKCVKCFTLRAKAAKQLMGHLPSPRVVAPRRAFENVGVDYAGPILIKTSPIRNAKVQKAYIALFICLAVKAVHLELVTDATTEAFIAALRRFTARRGYPATIYSDNGSNFVGANRELRELSKQFQSQEHSNQVNNHLLKHYTKWKFMCPTASHMGGLYEAGVKSTKNHLRRCIGSTVLTFEEYYTLLCQVEAVLNSRPLCSQSDDIEEYNYLSPGHFLIGEPLLAIPEPSLETINTNRLSRWQLIQHISQTFWKTFKTDYLNTLQQRNKWQTTEENLKVGDLVVVIEKELPPTKWHIARIVEVHPGNDQLVRVATIKSIHGVFKRPITKLAKLPVD